MRVKFCCSPKLHKKKKHTHTQRMTYHFAFGPEVTHSCRNTQPFQFLANISTRIQQTTSIAPHIRSAHIALFES